MPEKRNGTRASVELRVEYRTVGSFLSDWAVNISRGGLFIHTRNPLKVGSAIRMVFSLPGMPFLFDLNGEVKWIEDGGGDGEKQSGMGIEFIDLDERVRKRIEAYVKKFAEDIPASIREDAARERPKVRIKKPSGSDVKRNDVTQPSGRLTGDANED